MVHASHGHAIASSNARDCLVPTSHDGGHRAVFAPRTAAIRAAIEPNPIAQGPSDVHLAVRSHGRHGAFGGVVAIEAIACHVADAHRGRPFVSSLGGVAAQNQGAVPCLAAVVAVKLGPTRVNSLVVCRNNGPFFVLILRPRKAHASPLGPRTTAIGGTLADDSVKQRFARPPCAFGIAQMQIVEVPARTRNHARVAKHPVTGRQHVLGPSLASVLARVHVVQDASRDHHVGVDWADGQARLTGLVSRAVVRVNLDVRHLGHDARSSHHAGPQGKHPLLHRPIHCLCAWAYSLAK